ncbi:HNH endonuclease [Pseudoalteromonas sp. S1608]|uniref:HNH endonuclease n=1 Tax=Pseudoalteromonas sp. S1608 TaxID=579504 RepID=UPI001BB1CFA0|nr:HNH endonuclease [Pseudoalteromonas sp. S1608]
MKALILILTLMASSSASAHSGRTNSEGCHNDKKRNEYHCHSSKSKPTSSTPNIIKPVPKGFAIGSLTYNRKDWPHWVDADNDCQDARAEILIRDSKSPVKFKRNKPCNVSWGEWIDPYTAQTFYKASDIDIDHIVPLAHAHEMGGKYWTRDQRRAFANDFENLLAVEDNANQSKGAQPPHKWMPRNKHFHCDYLNKWKYIKGKYGLKESFNEKTFINNLISSNGCN